MKFKPKLKTKFKMGQMDKFIPKSIIFILFYMQKFTLSWYFTQKPTVISWFFEFKSQRGIIFCPQKRGEMPSLTQTNEMKFLIGELKMRSENSITGVKEVREIVTFFKKTELPRISL